MDARDLIRAKIDLTARDCQAVSKSLAIIDPFISFPDVQLLSTAYTRIGIIGVIANQICRYSVICMGRVWDDRKDVTSLKNIIKLLKKVPEYKTAVAQTERKYQKLKDKDVANRVRQFRHDFIAHTSGNEQTELSAFTPNELRDFHKETCDLVEEVYELAHGRPAGLIAGYQAWCSESLTDWTVMLNN